MPPSNSTAPSPAPGFGKWNRKKRRAAKPTQQPKHKITKEERRTKYTAIARDRQTRQKSKTLICYGCRETGHSIQHCPHAAAGDGKKKNKLVAAVAICYKCGSTEHTLAACPKKKSNPNDDSLPYATCFICEERGHLASSCPNNEHGIYVNGGACKHCGSNQHRGVDCPENAKKKERRDADKGRVEEVDINDLLEGEDDSQTKHTSTSKEENHKRNSSNQADNSKQHAKKSEKKSRVVNF